MNSRMPDSLGRDKLGENTRNNRGLCYSKECRGKAITTITYFEKQVKVCKRHEYLNGVK